MTVTLGAGALNDPTTAALVRAWRRRQGRFLTAWAERAIRQALGRIEREETSLQMELARVNRRLM